MSDTLELVLRNLNSEIAKVENRSIAGLMAGGLVIQGEAQRRVPVEHGHLRASAYTQREGNNVYVGFTAIQAAQLHENLEAKWRGRRRKSGVGVYWGPRGEPRFLANAVRVKSADVVAAVAKNSEVRK